MFKINVSQFVIHGQNPMTMAQVIAQALMTPPDGAGLPSMFEQVHRQALIRTFMEVPAPVKAVDAKHFISLPLVDWMLVLHAVSLKFMTPVLVGSIYEALEDSYDNEVASLRATIKELEQRSTSSEANARPVAQT